MKTFKILPIECCNECIYCKRGVSSDMLSEWRCSKTNKLIESPYSKEFPDFCPLQNMGTKYEMIDRLMESYGEEDKQTILDRLESFLECMSYNDIKQIYREKYEDE